MTFYNTGLYWMGFGTAVLCLIVSMIILYFVAHKIEKLENENEDEEIRRKKI